MSIDSPISYSDWYWKNSVDAKHAISEHAEKSYAPVIQQILTDTGLAEIWPASIHPLMTNLLDPKDPDWDDAQRMFLGTISRAVTLVAGDEMARPFQYEAAEKFLNLRIDAESATLLKQRQKIDDVLYFGRMHSAGYADSEMIHFYNSRIPYPSIPDIITYARYGDNPDNPKATAFSLFDIPPNDWPLWEWLSRMKLNTEQVQTLYKRGFLSTNEADIEFARIGWQGLDKFSIKSLTHSVPNAMLMVQGDLINNVSREAILENISIADIHPKYAETYLDAVLTKPQTIDLVAYELRQDPSLSQLDKKLQQVGVHPNYTHVYKELAYQIPPVQDIITMAVREAFTPSIAARFGQYEDLPPDLVEWSQKKGLSKEWAERYWAAHWSLPSPQQGFEMLHRGVINESDLHLLLRAADVMPFWRDKLVKIAYQPLTRVDVRRMYKLGVIDVNGVNKAYRDLGYNDYNANLMTQFTIEYTKGVPKKLSTTAIVSSYNKHLIESGELRGLLDQAGIDSNDIDPIIRTASQKRDWSDQEDKIDTLEYLYKQSRNDEATTVAELRNLGLTEEHIRDLIPQWTAKSIAERVSLWTTSQTLAFMKKGLITTERGRQELIVLGYDDEHINAYLASIVPAV